LGIGAVSTTPSIVAELSNSTGNFRTIGSVAARSSFSGNGSTLTGLTKAQVGLSLVDGYCISH
jgi:hypothetical protein